MQFFFPLHFYLLLLFIPSLSISPYFFASNFPSYSGCTVGIGMLAHGLTAGFQLLILWVRVRVLHVRANKYMSNVVMGAGYKCALANKIKPFQLQ